MNTQLARTHHEHQHHHHDGGVLHTTAVAEGGTGEEEHHHGGVKSVLKKVKRKAKKVKDTLKVHGHHHHNVPDDHDEEEDEDVDEEIIEDPAVHGAAGAMQPDYYDGGYSAADPMKLTPSEAGENRGGQRRKLADIKEEPPSPFNSPATISSTEPARDFVGGREKDRGHRQITMDEVTGGLEEDPHGSARSPANHRTKTLDRTDAGGEEAGVPLTVVEALEKAHISEGGKLSQGNDGGGGLGRRTRDVASSDLPTGSHNNQFSPEATKHEDEMKTRIRGDRIGEAAQNQSSYSDRISSATAVIADKAISAKNAVASKLGYGETAGEHRPDSNSASPVEYGKKVAATVTEKLTPVYETVASTVASAGNTLMSRVHGGGGGITSDVVTESEGERNRQQDKGVSVKDYFAEKLKPTEDDKALSDVISEALPWRKTTGSEGRKPMGKVTESKEVRKRLGTEDDRKKEEMEIEESSVSIPGVGGVVW